VAAEAEADLAALLGDDDRDGVGLLADPERGAVAGAEVRGQVAARQRQDRAGALEAQVADDHRAVVELVVAARDEEGDEELLGHPGVDLLARVDELVEADLALED